jgi:hypothetical protein
MCRSRDRIFGYTYSGKKIKEAEKPIQTHSATARQLRTIPFHGAKYREEKSKSADTPKFQSISNRGFIPKPMN